MSDSTVVALVFLFIIAIILVLACWVLFYGAIFYIIYLVLKHIGLISICALV